MTDRVTDGLPHRIQ